MARKSLQDMSGIANTIAKSGTAAKPAVKSSAPALGALQGALSAIREIDPGLIDDWGPADRLDQFTAVNSDDEADGFGALKDSIAQGGQQVPILVRRAPAEGRFEMIYGRRRLRACRELGVKVRANVQDIDDATALLAKGLENAARRNLSFYEKARFAAAIQAAGHDTKTVRQVLSLSASGLSHLTKVTEHVPNAIGDLIGAAPKSGRPKWTALAELFIANRMTKDAAKQFLSNLDPGTASDDRLDLLLKESARQGARTRETREVAPLAGVTIKSGPGAVTMSVRRAGETAGFAHWLDDHLEDIIKKSYAEYAKTRSGG